MNLIQQLFIITCICIIICAIILFISEKGRKKSRKKTPEFHDELNRQLKLAGTAFKPFHSGQPITYLDKLGFIIDIEYGFNLINDGDQYNYEWPRIQINYMTNNGIQHQSFTPEEFDMFEARNHNIVENSNA